MDQKTFLNFTDAIVKELDNIGGTNIYGASLSLNRWMSLLTDDGLAMQEHSKDFELVIDFSEEELLIAGYQYFNRGGYTFIKSDSRMLNSRPDLNVSGHKLIGTYAPLFKSGLPIPYMTREIAVDSFGDIRISTKDGFVQVKTDEYTKKRLLS